MRSPRSSTKGHGDSRQFEQSGDEYPGRESDSEDNAKKNKSHHLLSIGKKVIVAILIGVIIVLIILLIYQLYKYCTCDEYGSSNGNANRMKKKSTLIKSNAIKDKKNDNKPANVSRIPDSVKNMDDSVINQLMGKSNKKNDTPSVLEKTTGGDISEVKSSTETQFDVMLQDIKPVNNTPGIDPVDRAELDMISEIMDNQIEVGNTETQTNTEIAKILREDMENEKRDNQTLIPDITTSDNSDITTAMDDYEADELGSLDNAITESTSAMGCSFLLIKGNRRGQLCNKKLSDENRCSRHLNK